MDRHDDKKSRPEDQRKDRSGDIAKKPAHAGHPHSHAEGDHATAAGEGNSDNSGKKPAQQTPGPGQQEAQQKQGQPLPEQWTPAKPSDDPSKRTPERQAGLQQHNREPTRR